MTKILQKGIGGISTIRPFVDTFVSNKKVVTEDDIKDIKGTKAQRSTALFNKVKKMVAVQ